MIDFARLALPPLAANLFLATLALGLGRRLLGRAPEPEPLRLALALPLGLVVVVEALFVVLALHRLRPGVLVAAGLVGLALAVPGLRLAAHEAAALARASTPRRRAIAISVAAASAALLYGLGLYPPTAWDAVIYHLPFARLFDESQGFAWAPHLRVPIFPAAAESLFAALRAIAGELAAQQLQATAVLATAALAAAWARERLVELPGAGALAAALYGAAPIVVFYAGTAYVDPLLALFATGALAALDRLRREPGARWAAVAGALAGGAAATKYPGLFFAVAAPALAALWGRRGARRRLAAIALAGVVAAAGPGYGRIVVATGNPVFPFAASLFGDSAWDLSEASDGSILGRSPGALPDGPAGIGERLRALPRLPWDLLAARERYNLQPPATPATLLLWPALALALWRAAWTRALAAVLGAFALALLPLPADARFLLPIAPALAVVGLAGVDAALTGRPRARRALPALALALWLPLPAYAAFEVVRRGPLPVEPARRAAYLARELPGYRAVAWLREQRGAAARPYLLHLERLHDAAGSGALGDHAGPERFRRVDGRLCDARELLSELARLGATHLVLPSALLASMPRGAAFDEAFALVYADGEAAVLELRGPPATGGAID